MNNKNLKNILILLITLVCAGAAAVFMGPTRTTNPDILLKLRLPRIIMGMIVGAGLAGSGTIMQGVLRNPLADPYILGTSAGAALGVIAASALGIGYYSPLFYLLTIAGAFIATAISYMIARVENKAPVVNLLLSGVIVNTFFGAMILFFFMLRKESSSSILLFIMGNITEGTDLLLIFSAILLFIGLFIGMFGARHLDILALGEEKAAHMGVPTEKLKILMFLASSFMASAAVASAGTVGFVGLIVPHILRLMTGPSNRNLIVNSAIGGAIFVVVMDAFARTILAPREIPVGILTAFTGAPFFLWLLRTHKKEYRF